MITDCTTFSIEYLGTGKPLLLTTDDITQCYNHEDVLKSLYVGEESNKIIEFLENIRNGIDPKRVMREEYIDKTIFYPNSGTIGEYISENILNDLIREQEILSKRLCE